MNGCLVDWKASWDGVESAFSWATELSVLRHSDYRDEMMNGWRRGMNRGGKKGERMVGWRDDVEEASKGVAQKSLAQLAHLRAVYAQLVPWLGSPQLESHACRGALSLPTLCPTAVGSILSCSTLPFTCDTSYFGVPPDTRPL